MTEKEQNDYFYVCSLIESEILTPSLTVNIPFPVFLISENSIVF